MSRVIAVAACGFILAGCSMSMPSLDFFRSTPAAEQLRIESEPPGADATTSQGQTCRTPCELSVPTAGELAVTFALNGYQQMTVPIRAEGEGSRLQPNPVYAELQPMAPPRPTKKKAPAKKRTLAKKQSPASDVMAPAAAAPAPAQPAAPEPATAFPSGGYPWPPAPQ